MSARTTTLLRTIAADHPAFDGHFPGRPLLPGAALLAEVMEALASDPALAEALGQRPLLNVAKFLAPIGPGSTLEIECRATVRSLDFHVHCGGRSVAKGQFSRGAPA